MSQIEKIFLGSITVFSLAAAAASYQMYSALTIYDSLEGAQQAYHDISSVLTYAVPSAFLILLVFSSAIFRRSDKMRYFMFSFLFFSVFTVIDYVFIGEMYFLFIKNNGLWKGGFSIMALAGLFLCFCAFIIAAANYLILSTIKKISSTPQKGTKSAK